MTSADHLKRIGHAVANAMFAHVDVGITGAMQPVYFHERDHEALGKAVVQALIFAGYVVTTPEGDAFRVEPKAVP